MKIFSKTVLSNIRADEVYIPREVMCRENISDNTKMMFGRIFRRMTVQKHFVQIGNKDIRGCKNCDACRNTLNGNCVQQDDMQELYPLMRECEMFVIASPIYYYSMTGQTHCAVERIYAFERLPKIKKAALLLSAGGGGFTSAIQTYKDAIIGHMGARDMGIVKSVGNRSRSEAVRKEIQSIVGKL